MRLKSKRIYSWDVTHKVENQMPPPILEAMAKLGWNVFGVYEIVADALKAEKRRLRLKQAEKKE